MALFWPRYYHEVGAWSPCRHECGCSWRPSHWTSAVGGRPRYASS